MKIKIRIAIIALVLVLAGSTAWAAPSDALPGALNTWQDSALGMSCRIRDLKGQGQQELKSSALLKEELQALGFTVKSDLPMPADLVPGGVSKTAFRAEFKGSRPGPTITIMLEYDALPN